MPSGWQTVRVFISSTFRDMHAERDWLVRVVFPALRERLLPHRLHLDDIDLRWGVTQEQAERDMALDLCLAQIDQSRPFFLGLLGERYGYVPDRFTADAASKYGWAQHHTGKSITELEIVYGVLGQQEMRPRAMFFFRDPAFLKDVPAPLHALLEESRDSGADGPREKLARLKQAIRNAGLPIGPVENYPCRFAGLRLNWRIARLSLAADDVQALAAVAQDGLITSDEFARLDVRRQEIVNRLAIVYLDHLEEFGRAVEERLWAAIREQYNLDEAAAVSSAERDELAEELNQHLRFRDARLRVYVGREALERELEEYAASAEPTPCLVTAPSGAGKSAALARFARDFANAHPDVVVVPHFVGASPASTSVRAMLRRFCRVLRDEFHLADKNAPAAEQLAIPATIPETTAELITCFADFVSRVPAARRVVFVIDAVNQLDPTDNDPPLRWLPRDWPAHVKAVVSCIADPGRAEPVLDAFAKRPKRLIELPPLDDGERREIIRAVPSLSAKTLDDLQVGMLLDNPATANPLYLLVALEELRGFGSFEQLDLRIAGFPRPGAAPVETSRPSAGAASNRDERARRRGAAWSAAVAQAPHVNDPITALFDQVIDRLHDDFGREPADSVLALLASARRGLSERELAELTVSAASRSGATHLPSPLAGEGSGMGGQGTQDVGDKTHGAMNTAIAAALFPVLRQLRPYLQHRGTLLDFYHRHLLTAVRARLLPDESTQAAAHQRLADYFRGQEYFLEDLAAQQARAQRLPPTPRPVNIRKVDELPWQLLRVGQLAGKDDASSPHWNALADLLLDWQFLEAKAEAVP